MAKQSKPTIAIDDKHKVSTGADFELEVADYMEKSIFSGDWRVSPHFAKVRRKPAYFSKTRTGDIVFDVSVEIFMKSDPVHPMFIWILECKDYESRNVNVDEVEEFHHKIQQVGAHKGLIFTRQGFAVGAIEVARTHKIGLSILNQGKVMTLEASASGGFFGSMRSRLHFG